jgi:6-phospho-3-hexuloisomerase
MKNHYQSLVKKTLEELELVLDPIEEHAIEALLQALQDSARIFISGKGRSGLQMRAFAMRLMHLGMQCYMVDDVTTPGIKANDLLLIGSGSGQTPSLVEHASKAKREGARLALITANQDSPIALQADVLVLLSAPTPKAQKQIASKSVHPMGTLFEQSLGLFNDLFILLLMDRLEIDSETMFTRHANLE